ncbi:MAG: L-histidine N(alpha)-methyltransferase [Planctomycetes bacterium]|nr:L-histidine N(alpha)-methyltransferase [Planctomycetota bacterium]
MTETSISETIMTLKDLDWQHKKYIPLVQPDKLRRKLIEEVCDGSELVNKYLYLGEHGAMLWKDVDKTYCLGRQGTPLLENHFGDIDEVIRSSAQILGGTSASGYDIISLGCGSGEDDIEILRKIEQKIDAGVHVPRFNIITVDLSWELLFDGTENIRQHLENHRIGQYVNDLVALWCDIETLINASSYIISGSSYRLNGVALFHMLGLTLSNNNEERMFRAISNVMQEKDFLLVGVDFSMDDNKALINSRKAYENKTARKKIDEFLCGPLLYATRHAVNEQSKLVSIGTRFGSNDYIKYPIQVDHVFEIDNKHNTSSISTAANLVRYHRFKATSTKGSFYRQCDFSNKYAASEFGKYISWIREKKGIPFGLAKDVGVYGIDEERKKRHEPFQHLVLIQYMRTLGLGTSDEEEIERRKRFLVDISEKIRRIQRKWWGLIPKKEYSELLKLYDPNTEENVKRLSKTQLHREELPELLSVMDSRHQDQCKQFLDILRRESGETEGGDIGSEE